MIRPASENRRTIVRRPEIAGREGWKAHLADAM